MKKILISNSNPYPYSNGIIRYDREVKKIKRLHRASSNKNNFELIIEPAISFRNFCDDIKEYEPDILHINCHTDNDENFYFENENDDNTLEKIGWYNIASKISEVMFKKKVCLIFLNTCYSHQIALNLTTLSPNIDAAVGIKGAWLDDHAINLSKFFYEHYFATSNIRESLHKAKRLLDSKFLSANANIANRGIVRLNQIDSHQTRPSTQVVLSYKK